MLESHHWVSVTCRFSPDVCLQRVSSFYGWSYCCSYDSHTNGRFFVIDKGFCRWGVVFHSKAQVRNVRHKPQRISSMRAHPISGRLQVQRFSSLLKEYEISSMDWNASHARSSRSPSGSNFKKLTGFKRRRTCYTLPLLTTITRLSCPTNTYVTLSMCRGNQCGSSCFRIGTWTVWSKIVSGN